MSKRGSKNPQWGKMRRERIQGSSGTAETQKWDKTRCPQNVEIQNWRNKIARSFFGDTFWAFKYIFVSPRGISLSGVFWQFRAPIRWTFLALLKMKNGGASPRETSEKSRGGRAGGDPPCPCRVRKNPKTRGWIKQSPSFEPREKSLSLGGGGRPISGGKRPPKTPKSDRARARGASKNPKWGNM